MGSVPHGSFGKLRYFGVLGFLAGFDTGIYKGLGFRGTLFWGPYNKDPTI